jgi:ubiquinone/menaquinone biosynthesis C-methylase UbiE
LRLKYIKEDNMNYTFTEVDFEHPSFLFRLEDRLKGFLGFPLYNPFISLFDLRGNERILDFGCGSGAGSLYLLRKLKDNGSITCLDISEFWINRAKKRLSGFSNVTFMRGDIRRIGIPDGSFDIISIVHVIHDIHPRERESTVRSLAAKLKSEGRLFIYEPIRPSHGISIAEVKKLMKNAGLRDKKAILKKSSYIGQFDKKNSGED